MLNSSLKIVFASSIFFLTATITNADVQDEIVSLLEEATAQGECAGYIGFLYNDYTIGGFSDEGQAKKSRNLHMQKAYSTAESFVDLAIKNKVEGKYLIIKKGNSFCIGEMCLPKKEYIEAFFAITGLHDSQEQIAKKDITCPNDIDVWFPCKGAEPVDNRQYKAADMYKSKNCKLLLR